MAQEANMPSKLPKFEDWTRPWKDDEFDADKAARLIYNLHTDKETITSKAAEKAAESATTITELQGKVNGFETKDLSEVDRLKRENEALKNATPEPAGDNLEAARLRIALKKGLSEAQAGRLVGTTADELETDADAYIEEHGLTAAGESGSGKPPARRPSGNLKTGLGEGGEEGDDADFDPADLIKDLPRSRF